MKYLASFHNTLKVSRYLFRALAILLWVLVAFVSVFYIVNALHDRESEIRQEFNLNADQAQRYIQRTADVIKELKYVAGNRPMDGSEGGDTPVQRGDITIPNFEPLYPDSDCALMSTTWRNSLQSLAWFMRYWRDNFSTAYDLNRIFMIGSDNLCMANFGLRDIPLERDQALKVLHQRIEQYRDAPQNERGNNLFWISQGVRPGVGYFYALTPIYVANRLQAMLGVEQTIRMESFFTPGSLPMNVTILDDNGQTLISLAGSDSNIKPDAKWMQERLWFGYTAGFRELAMKKSLPPSSLSIVYSVPVDQVLERIRMLILNAVVLNLLTGGLLFALARMYERRIFIPAENDAQRLEEHEQFNRKIVASAPVGICILRTIDGTNILSNELAHNYLNMLTHEDRQRLTQIICGQQVNFVDVLTSNNTNLQISFVHSRYRNENVAICVLVDV
ncbi:two-component system sensor histidine kinase RcsC, partial [Klebsiella michiganensis]